MHKKLSRKTGDGAMVAGVLSGLADYFNQDPVLFRLLAIVLMVFTGFFPGAFLYLVAWIMMPIDTGVTYEVAE